VSGAPGISDARPSPGCGSCDDRPPSHAESRRESATRLRIAVALVSSYLVAEAVGGWITNSLALMADAGHMLSDVAALAISLAALKAAARPATARRTWGYHRAEALAALANAVALGVVAVGICVEAVQRLASPPEVAGPLALAIASGGLVVNLVGLGVLGHDHDHGIGVRSAWLHMLGDALGSAGAMASAASIWLLGWNWADPVASVLIAVLIVRSALALLFETVGVLMEGAPAHLDVDEVRGALEGLPGVVGVHDLHVWTITSGLDALSGHVVVGGGTRPRDVLAASRALLHERFGLDHVTLQLEGEDEHPPASR
jgi:cobalt-zinc-cadmium efflux system protein